MLTNRSYDLNQLSTMTTTSLFDPEAHRIADDMERSLLITWTVIVFLSSFVGDGIILLGTIKYNAIKLNKVIVVVMQHLAVTDLVLATFDVLPTTVALVANDWVLGEVLQNVQIHIKNTFNVAVVLLNCAMAILKMVYLWRPLRCAGWTTRFGHTLCAVLWTLMLCIYTPVLIGSMVFIRQDIHFDFKTYTNSYYLYESPIWLNTYTLIFSSLLSFIPSIVLLFTSMLIIILAQRSASRHGEKMRREGSTTVLLTVAVFFVSYLPNAVTNLLLNFNQLNLGGPGKRALFRTIHFLTFLNVMANFFVYALTVRSFRTFLKINAVELFIVVCPNPTLLKLRASWTETTDNWDDSTYRSLYLKSIRSMRLRSSVMASKEKCGGATTAFGSRNSSANSYKVPQRFAVLASPSFQRLSQRLSY